MNEAESGTPESVPTTPSIAFQSPKTSTQASIETLARQFHALFLGYEAAHGTYSAPTEEREDGKLEGSAKTKREAVSDHLWKLHLEGKQGLGVIPITADDTVLWGAVDIDQYDGLDHAAIASTLKRLGIPLVTCRSKSGGAHLYLFCAAPVPADKMRKKLRAISALIGQGTSEIFPKQSKVLTEQNDLGSWINMPFFDVEKTTRYAVNPQGDAMSPEQFLAAAEAAKVGPEFFTKKVPATMAQGALPDGPPCLQHLMELGFPPGTWNSGMLNLGIYCKKAYGEAWKGQLVQLNAVNFPVDKWPVSDLDGVFKSLSKKDYRYQCDQHPLKEHCNQGLCRTRKHGVGGGTVPEFGPLTKCEGDETIWFWSVNQHRVRLTTSEIVNQRKFRERCADIVTLLPSYMKQEAWDGLVQRAMATADIVAASEDTTKAGEVWELLEKYWHSPQATSMEEVLNGSPRPFNGPDGRSYFKLAGLAQFLKRHQFRDMSRGEIGRVITQRGGQHHFVNPRGEPGEKRTGVNYWSVPTPAQPGTMELPAALRDPGVF